MTPQEREYAARVLRSIADTLLVPVAMTTQIPEDVLQAFVRGTSEGAVEAGKKAGKRKNSAYQRKYKAAFKRISPRYKLKSGKWKKDGFKRAVKEAHKIAGGKKR